MSMKNRIEIVAQAIWDAKTEDDDSPKWEELNDLIDASLKEEIRVMAKAAIKACDESK